MPCRMRDNSIYCGNEANVQWLSFATYKQIIYNFIRKEEKKNEITKSKF